MSEAATSTTAILHHNLRGSGREVIVRLEKAGLALSTMQHEPIAVWLYDTLEFATPQEHSESAELRVPHDELTTLRLFGEDLINDIVARAPELRTQRREGQANWALRLWAGIPDQPKVGICFAALLGILWVAAVVRDLFD